MHVVYIYKAIKVQWRSLKYNYVPNMHTKGTKDVHSMVSSQCQGKEQISTFSSGSALCDASHIAWHGMQLDVDVHLKLDKRKKDEEVLHTHTHLIQSATVISKHKASDLFRQPNTALSDGTSMVLRNFIMAWLLVSAWPVPAPYWNRWPATSSHTITFLCFLSSPYPCFSLCLNKPAFLTTSTQ